MRQPHSAAAPPMPADDPMPVSLADLRRFLEELRHQTTVARRTLDAYRVAVASLSRVPAWTDTTDISELDINAATRRYLTATAGQHTPHTRNTYTANARRAITLFLEWVDNGLDWRVVRVGQAAARDPSVYARHRFPLREDVVVTLRLPTTSPTPRPHASPPSSPRCQCDRTTRARDAAAIGLGGGLPHRPDVPQWTHHLPRIADAPLLPVGLRRSCPVACE
jgi:hypothetical protein